MLNKILAAFVAVIAFFTNSFSTVKTYDEILDGGVRVSYGESVNQVYDIFVPENAMDEVNVLLSIHGGAWMFGSMTEYDRVMKTACDEYGFVGVTMEYRMLTQGAQMSDMMDDVNTVILSVKDYLAKQGIAAKKMIIGGHSAGGQLSLLYAYTHIDTSPIDIAFIVDACGPTDFYEKDAKLPTIMGTLADVTVSCMTGEAMNIFNREEKEQQIADVSPISKVTALCQPTLIFQGNRDTMVPYENSVNLQKKLDEAGVYNEFITVEGKDHFFNLDKIAEGDAIKAAFFRFAEMYL